MTWWCAATRLPWSWSPRAYPGVWLFIASIAVGAVTVVRRSGIRPSRREALAFWSGLAFLWIASDWPIGTLGSGYLASAHMLQYFLYTFVATPLLVLAIPERLALRATERPRLARANELLSRPWAAALVANAVLLATHAPFTVDTFRVNQAGSFVLDLIWIVGGIALWWPICGPIREFRPSYPVRCVYLFLAAGLVPMLPGGFLTFADFPLYALYELAPRVGDLDPVEDQQMAGALMKVGSIPIIWPVIGTMFWRWAKADPARLGGPGSVRRVPASDTAPTGQG
ncbi:MAG TPA: cytochrome c oxidase assembly protein [Acidimicrobiales bacterium]|nr:cytochrome c oxidase assembly protein [Acidimicrobiales bacterium]